MLTKEQKAKIIEEIENIFKNYSTIGFLDFFKLGTREYRELKKELMKKVNVQIKFFKRNLVLKALEKLNLKHLENFVPYQVGLIYSNENPFKIYKEIKKLYTYRIARENDIAEEDIIIKPMITNIPAGPSIAEFQKLKIEVGVESGKIAIKKEKLLVKKGEKINAQIASLLQKLGLKPIKVKLNVTSFFSNNILFSKEILELDEEFYTKEIVKCFNIALSLSEKICFYNRYNIKTFVQKAYRIATETALKAEIINSKTIEILIKKAYLIADNIKKRIKL